MNAGPIIFILVSIGIGYVLEPILISDTKKLAEQKAEDSIDSAGEDVIKPVENTEPELQVDLNKITADDFPEKVALKVPFTIKDAASGASMSFKKGNEVQPLRLEGDQLVIQSVAFPVEGKIDVKETNFVQLAVPRMLARLQKERSIAKNDPPSAVTPDPEPVTIPEPAPAPEPVVNKLDEAAIVLVMKASVEDGEVSEFETSQVTSWKAGNDMEFDGETYQTGIVTFKAQTILGVQEHDAIALIKDDGIHKWMWAKTKLEMR